MSGGHTFAKRRAHGSRAQSRLDTLSSYRAAIDEILKTLLGGQSPAFREVSILLQDKLLQDKRIQIAQGHLIVDGRATRTLTMMRSAPSDPRPTR
jgi:hypothetical protein